MGYDTAGTSCYCTITGKVYDDQNGNCVYDAGEPGIRHIMMHCDPFGYAFTDVNGDYSFRVPSGSYTISEVVQNQYPLAACQNNYIPVTVTASSGCTNMMNFANSIAVLHDLHICRISLYNAIPGNTYAQEIIVSNDGTVTESAIQLGFRHDGQLYFTGTMPSVYTQTAPVADPGWYSVNSGFPPLAPGESTVLQADYAVPLDIPLGTLVNFKDTISAAVPLSSWSSDYTPWNNVKDYQTVVTGSYDPNFKEVSPKGTGPQGYIHTSDSVLDYVVHFQNTGTYYAQKVVVVDSLDSDLDWTSLRLGYSDHNYTATMSENGVLTFIFDNIQLDWQSNNGITSRGLVMYSIKQKPDLVPATEIRNSAAIYFDYNAPVMTNQTLNTITALAGVVETSADNNISIYPNPANDRLTIGFGKQTNVEVINIYDLQGRIVQSEKAMKNGTVQQISVSNLVKGLYFIELQKSNGERSTARFVKD